MFIRQISIRKNGKRHAYWALVESYRTERGPRQRIVSYLGQMDVGGRLGIQYAAQCKTSHQKTLFDDVEPEWVEVDVNRVRVEGCVDFGGPWLALQLIRKLQLDTFLKETIPTDRAEISWSAMTQVLVVSRFCDPSSELHIAEHSYAHSALKDLLGIPVDKINDDRLYRSLDKLLPHKEKLEIHLKNRLGELFDLSYDLLLYDITSTCFEGQALWSEEYLWRAYMQLTEAEAAFRIHKSDLCIRPIWHQQQERVEAHILVCFLSYVLWKTLGQMCRQSGLGDEPRRVIEELSKIKAVDVVMPTRLGIEIRRRCVSQPTDYQTILLQCLGLQLPHHLPITERK